ncbi:succinyl-CoA:glutarate CoA-transferase [Sebastes fasciatus]
MFEGSGVPVGPINNIQEVFSDPQVKHNGLIQEMNHPTAGRIAVPGPAVRFSSFPVHEPTPPPLIGQHTVQVLRDTLSYADDVIEALLESRAVTQNEVS